MKPHKCYENVIDHLCICKLKEKFVGYLCESICKPKDALVFTIKISFNNYKEK